MRNVSWALAFFAIFPWTFARTEEASDIGKVIATLTRTVFPNVDAELIGTTATGGTTTYFFLSKYKSSLEERIKILREYREIGLSKTQFSALKKGDRVVFYSEDLEELHKITDNMSKIKGTLWAKVVDGERSWRFKATVSNLQKYEDLALDFEPRLSGVPSSGKIAEEMKKLQADELLLERRTGPLTSKGAQSSAKLMLRPSEEHTLIKTTSNKLRILRFARRLAGPLVLAVTGYEIYKTLNRREPAAPIVPLPPPSKATIDRLYGLSKDESFDQVGRPSEEHKTNSVLHKLVPPALPSPVLQSIEIVVRETSG